MLQSVSNAVINNFTEECFVYRFIISDSEFLPKFELILMKPEPFKVCMGKTMEKSSNSFDYLQFCPCTSLFPFESKSSYPADTLGRFMVERTKGRK